MHKVWFLNGFKALSFLMAWLKFVPINPIERVKQIIEQKEGQHEGR